MLGDEVLVGRLVKIQFEPDEPSGVPGETGIFQLGSQQAARVSPGRPYLDEQRQLALLCLISCFGVIVTDKGEYFGGDCCRQNGHEDYELRYSHSCPSIVRQERYIFQMPFGNAIG